MTFQTLVDTLIAGQPVIINGQPKIPKGVARYASINFPQGEYLKASFIDGSGLVAIFEDQSVFYSERKLGAIPAIPDEIIGVAKTLEYQGKIFNLVNAHDYQYVKELYLGSPTEIEGEVKFSDYLSGDNYMLSVGWNMFTGNRDDVYAVPVNLANLG